MQSACVGVGEMEFEKSRAAGVGCRVGCCEEADAQAVIQIRRQKERYETIGMFLMSRLELSSSRYTNPGILLHADPNTPYCASLR